MRWPTENKRKIGAIEGLRLVHYSPSTQTQPLALAHPGSLLGKNNIGNGGDW
ncbi:hypothetical protein SLEP1_g3026 [Rubroshorea leprosula]|uniref:Uncharacterized protein n=1 Tax=Rubroshorea leprosula TaxID=152421 RepID=A0AAV5HJ39_9ROSI|nr:hypothetical protein SLEP1_g3026 [Rubroshorea leprosula]